MPRPTNFSRFAALTIFLALFLLPAFAQDASQVLRMSVGFNTLKNSVKLSDEKKTELVAIEAKAQIANSEKRYGDALRYLSQGMALMRGQNWTPAQALNTALQMKLDRVLADPGDTVKLTLTQLFALEEPINGKLRSKLMIGSAKNKEMIELKTLADVTGDFAANPLTVEVKLPELADADYFLTLSLKTAADEPITKSASLQVSRGLAAMQKVLRDRAAKAANAASQKPELIRALAAVDYHLSIPELVSAGQITGSRDFRRETLTAASYLNQIEKGESPLRMTKGDFRWAYRSDIDNSLQPYRIFVPSKYDTTKPTPLVVALHGMGGDENSYFVAYDNGIIKREAEARGYLVVCPKGRGNASMYAGDAEKDVLDVIAAMRRDYNVDADRIYLTGHSMGGYGTWSIAPKYPELFAAIAPISGGGNPQSLAKIKHVPQIVIHGDNDPTVSVERSRAMVRAAKGFGIEIKYIEVPGGNHTDIAVPAQKDIFDFFDTHKRQSMAETKAAGAGGNR